MDSPAPERPRTRHRRPSMAAKDEMARPRSGSAGSGGLRGVATATGGEEAVARCEEAVRTGGAAFCVPSLAADLPQFVEKGSQIWS